MALTRDLVAARSLIRSTLARRRARHLLGNRLATDGPLPAGTFHAAVYFSDPPRNLYQIRQWYGPLERLAQEHPVVVLTRHPETALAVLHESKLPVLFALHIADVERFIETQPLGAVFYVNQSRNNFEMFRYPAPAHVFLSHGESDKVYMASNQLKAYDAVFVAGVAAQERVIRRLYDFDPAHLHAIGRPQIDVAPRYRPELPADGRTTVLYAPTWEGDRPSMAYGSLSTHGPGLVRALIATGRHRVVFRAHPRTGLVDPGARAALSEVERLLEDANRTDPAAGHVVDRTAHLDWQLTAADVCVCDVSAVAFDWLATGRPLLLTRPVAPEADLAGSELTGSVPMLAADDVSSVASVVDELTVEGQSAYTSLVHHHFGDTSPGASMARFLAASDRVISDRHAAQRERQ